MAATLATHRRRALRDWEPRLSAIEIVDTGDGWHVRLNDRATHLELALLALAYGCAVDRQESDAVILKPRAGIPCPTRRDLVQRLETIQHERRATRG